MAITQGLCNSGKVALFNGEVDFSSDTSAVYKMALYTSAATIGPPTNAYTAANEVSGTGYTAGGETMTISENPQLSGSVAIMDFDDVLWSSATIVARGALIYKSGGSNLAIAVLDFGADISISGGNFIVQMPAFTSTTAIFRVA